MRAPGFGLIEVASRLVPRRRRGEWRREWEAETAYAWERLLRRGSPSAWGRFRLWVRVLCCWIDAFVEMKEDLRMTGFLDDLRYALRGLAHRPAFTAVAVLTLALGIGANTAVFTLVDGVMLRALPFPEPERLLSLRHQGREGRDALPVSDGLYVLYREQASSLEGIALYAPSEMNLLVGEEPERVPVQYATPSFFQVLEAQPTLGRAFLAEEELPDAEAVVILSDGLWRRSFGADPDVMGRTLDLNGVSRRVVGVMPPDFGFPDREAQAWLPYPVDPARAPLAAFSAAGIARMAPGSSLESVRSELQGLIGRLADLFPQSDEPGFLAEVGLKAQVAPLKEDLVGDVSTTLWVLLGTVGFVLLIACANVANLLLVRAESRQRELSVRLAMGAGRRDLLGVFMGESVVLAVAGAGLGMVAATWSLDLVTRYLPSNLPRMAEVGLDGRVLGFTALLSLGCALFFGLFPLLRQDVANLASQLKEGGVRGATHGPERHRMRNGLVMLQVALALVLLVGAGLMFRSFLALRSLDPGFQLEGIATARIAVPTGEIRSWQETAGLFRQLRERVAAQPGVEAVGFTARAPLTGGVGFGTIEVEDQPRGPDDLPVFSSRMSVGPGYFEAMGIPLRSGRTFQDGDGADGVRAAVISESFARHWWPDADPIGRRLGGGDGEESWWQIVGVVGDVHQRALEGDPEEMVYFPLVVGLPAQPQVIRTLDIVVRTSGSPLQLVPVLRRELRDLNPRIPLSNPRTMDAVFGAATAGTSFTMAMLGAASGIALLLGVVGIYGVISYVVSQRTREIGVRMALGASAPSVRRMVVRQGMVLALAGAGVGLVVAGSLSRLMASLLFGVSALDPLTYGGVAASLLLVAMLASWLPARRAAAVDPSRALREE